MIPVSDPDLRHSKRPYITVTLIAINVLVFLYQLTLTGVEQAVFSFQFGLIPSELAGGSEIGRNLLLYEGLTYSVDLSSPIPTWFTVVSSMFLHGGWLHLMGNMLFLWVFGDNVEVRFGRILFLALYFTAGIAAVLAHSLLYSDSSVPLIGASGAVSGVLGAYLILYPFSRITTLIIIGFIFAARIRAIFLLGLWGILQGFQGMFSLSGGGTSDVAHFAHLGGLLVGVFVIAIGRIINGEPIWQPYRYYALEITQEHEEAGPS